MKAIVQEKYGNPEQVLSLKEVSKPRPKENQVLIKIEATAVNDYEWGMIRGKPNLYRLLFGLFKPKHPILGMELSGIIEEIGAGVKNLKVGDAVFGDISACGFGALAEYLCIHEKAVIKKPADLTFEEAAAIPHAATLAWQALNDLGKIKEGEKILINGGGGGVGTIGLQMAKHYHCHVTGVDAGEKLDAMKGLGYDTVLDYKKVNFTKTGEQYDLILDCKTNKSFRSYVKALHPKGRYITIGGQLSGLFKVFLLGKLVSVFSSKKLQVLALKPNKDLAFICNLYQQNKMKCLLDGPYALEEVPRLIQYFGEGKHKGKIVIKPAFSQIK